MQAGYKNLTKKKTQAEYPIYIYIYIYIYTQGRKGGRISDYWVLSASV